MSKEEFYIKSRPKNSKEPFVIIGKLNSKDLADGYVVGLQKRELDRQQPRQEYIVVRKED